MRMQSLTIQFALLLIAVALIDCASRSEMRMPSLNVTAEESRVKGIVDQFYSAAERQDWDAVGDLLSADFEIYTDEASVFNKEDYVRLLKEDNLELNYMELRDMDLRVSKDGQMAWTKFRGFFKTTSHGEPSSVETAETLILKNEGRGWKITRAHASVKKLDVHNTKG